MTQLISLLSGLTIKDIRKFEEYLDKQFIALEFLYEKLENKEIFPILVILNSLISFQLNDKGENFWREFSEYSFKGENIIKEMKDFLKNSKTNKRFLNLKIKRIEKMSCYLDKIMDNYEFYYENMVYLNNFLANILKQKRDAKTIVFSVKMFGYSMRIYTKKFIPYPFEISIPLDNRIEKITKLFSSQKPKKFWDFVSKKTKIPPLHLDSVLWNLYGKNEVKIRDFLNKHFDNKLKEKILKLFYEINKIYKSFQ